MKMKSKVSTIIEVIACLLIMLFVYASISKVRDMEQFRIQLGQSPLVTAYAYPLSYGVPAVEVLISVLLVIPRFRPVGLYGSFSLMILFTFYIIAILQLDRNIPCSCGGILESMGWTEHLIFNIIFTLLAMTGVLLQPSAEAKLSNERTKILPAGD